MACVSGDCGVLKFRSCRRWEAAPGTVTVRCAVSESSRWQQCEFLRSKVVGVLVWHHLDETGTAVGHYEEEMILRTFRAYSSKVR